MTRKTKILTVRVTPPEHARLVQRASADHLSVSEAVRYALYDYARPVALHTGQPHQPTEAQR